MVAGVTALAFSLASTGMYIAQSRKKIEANEQENLINKLEDGREREIESQAYQKGFDAASHKYNPNYWTEKTYNESTLKSELVR